MEFREKRIEIEHPPGVAFHYRDGRWSVTVVFERELKNSNVEETTIVFKDVSPVNLRCIALGLHNAIDAWANDWQKTRRTLERGEE